MNTLLLRLASPIQSWGIDSKFETRRTHVMPTKSAVLGMVASAMGRRRTDSIEDLTELRFGVRIDNSGELLRDFHTAKPKKDKNPYVTYRYYLSDAVFLVGLEGELSLLYEIDVALRSPAYPLFLGRRSCPPEGKVLLGVYKNKPLERALQEQEWQISQWMRRKKDSRVKLPVVIEDRTSEQGSFRKDNPISFSYLHRKFAYRKDLEIEPVIIINGDCKRTKSSSITAHDPIGELVEE